MKRREIIHMISSAPFKLRVGRDAKTRCGKIACVGASNVGPTRYQLCDEHGNRFLGTGRDTVVTCKKCINLITIGTINGRPSRTSHAAH